MKQTHYIVIDDKHYKVVDIHSLKSNHIIVASGNNRRNMTNLCRMANCTVSDAFDPQERDMDPQIDGIR